MEKVTRFGVSIEPELLGKFDTLIERMGYGNRSKAVRDLIRKEIARVEAEKETGRVIGTLTLIYDHEVGEVTDKLLDAQHHHHSIVVSTTHMHIDERNCLEVLMIQGKSRDVRDFANKLIATKGVKHGKLVIASTEIL